MQKFNVTVTLLIKTIIMKGLEKVVQTMWFNRYYSRTQSIGNIPH